MHNELVSPMPLGNMDSHNVPGEYSMNERGDVSHNKQQRMSADASLDHIYSALVTRHHYPERFTEHLASIHDWIGHVSRTSTRRRE